jgi:hypothetical protein
MAEKMRKKEKDGERKREREKVLAAERQRRHWERKKAEAKDELSDDNNINVVLLRGADAVTNECNVDVAGTSRAGTQGWRNRRNGTKGGAV